MALTKHKLKKQVMEKTLKNAEQGGKKEREDDPKILPFFQLETGQKMEVMFLPTEDGDLFKHFKKHGPNMGNSAVGTIECIYHARGESCAACAEGFSHTTKVNGATKGTDLSKKWMAKDYYIAQCVVINSPVDLKPLEDGNQVRIFYMPYAVMEKIKEAFAEGIVEDPTEHIFYIKKTEDKNGRASYKNSYFAPMPADQEIYDAFEDEVVELHDLVEAGIQPEPASKEEVEEWTAKAVDVLSNGTSNSSDGNEDSGYNNRQSGSDDDDNQASDGSTDSGDADAGQKEEKKEDKPANKSGLSLKERLAQSRGK